MAVQVGLQNRDMAKRLTLEERVTQRFKALAEGRGFRTALARRLGKTPSAITPYVNGSTPVSLEVLEAVSELAQVPVAELVSSEASEWKELAPHEASLLRALRKWPETVSRALLAFVTYFADEPVGAGQTRAMNELWRHLSQPDRDVLESYAMLLRRKALDRGQLERITHQATADAEALTEPPTVGPGLKFQRPRRKP